jgi:tetratricopeptide (TPR) repeat protein
VFLPIHFLKKLLYILFIIAFGFCNHAFAQNAKHHIKAGEQFLENGLTDAAVEEFNKAIALDPEEGKAYSSLAEALLVKGDSLAVAENYQKAAALDFDAVHNYHLAADYYYRLENTGKALESIEAGLLIKPKDIDLLLLKAQIYYYQKEYTTSYEVSAAAIKSKDLALAYFYNGASAFYLGNIEEAEKNLEKAIIRDKNLAEAYLVIAEMQLGQEKYEYAVDNCSMVLLLLDPENVRALVLRSRAFQAMNEPDDAISDITKAIGLSNNNEDLLLERAQINLDYALYSDAIHDYSIVISQNPSSLESYQNRAYAYEQLGQTEMALSDYIILQSLLESSGRNPELKLYTQNRIFELGEETIKPVVEIETPNINDNLELSVEEGLQKFTLRGIILDNSDLKELKVNNSPVSFVKEAPGRYVFSIELATANLDFVSVTAMDVYDNVNTESYPISYIETEAPMVEMISPVAGTAGVIQLEAGDNTLYIEGRVIDKSHIVSIKVDEVNASFTPGDYNPKFTATIDIQNRKNLTITATDAFGNETQKVFEFAKDGYLLSDNNPMGKTWVVVIENTQYQEFTNLSAPARDIKLLTAALDRYQVSKILHKKNMTKRELERFFAIDLRDLIISNQVNSLLIWYAGHGENVNDIGYWIPTDGRQGDEYSFYNINALKASLYSYQSLTHTLVVSDACHAGESFTIAMRGSKNSLATCNDLSLITSKSALVLTSAYREPALDNSYFARTFANALANNPADCIPIDAIAERITIVMNKNTAQKPVFGRISGLEDHNGTFFFVTK